VQSKIYKALHKAYHGALEESMADSRPQEELQRVEIFIRKWIDDSMSRAWYSLEAVGVTLTDKSVLRLFQALAAPFGDEHPYSCIPDILTKGIGRPPQDWKFIGQAVKQLFNTLKIDVMASGSGGSSRKRRKGSSAAPVAEAEAPPLKPLNSFTHNAPTNRCVSEAPAGKSEKDETLLKRERSPAGITTTKFHHQTTSPFQRTSDRSLAPPDDLALSEKFQSLFGSFDPEDSPVDDVEPDTERLQHPDCTSANDCVGRWGQHLIRHMVDGAQQGDIYCEECWRSFLWQNRNLQGFWEDGPLQGRPVDMQNTVPEGTA